MQTPRLPAPHALFLLAAAFCAALLGYAYFAQFVQGYEPCPLCIFQRMAVFFVGLICLVAGLHRPKRVGRAVYGSLSFIAAAIGAGIAGRHVWLQNLPVDQVPDCGPGLEYMFDVFPAWEALQMVFSGSGECAEVDWFLLGLSMPGWVLVCCVGLAVFGVWNGFRR